jgi:hypothetical protein
MRVAGHHRILRESLVPTCVRNDEHFRLHDRVCAEGLGTRRFLNIETEPRFEPLPVAID